MFPEYYSQNKCLIKKLQAKYGNSSNNIWSLRRDDSTVNNVNKQLKNTVENHSALYLLYCSLLGSMTYVCYDWKHPVVAVNTWLNYDWSKVLRNRNQILKA